MTASGNFPIGCVEAGRDASVAVLPTLTELRADRLAGFGTPLA